MKETVCKLLTLNSLNSRIDKVRFLERRIKMIPVYVINGFLDSGKSEFINYTISQPYFQTRGKTLLILCEEGEVTFSEEVLKKSRTVVEEIEDEEDFNSSKNLPCVKKE